MVWVIAFGELFFGDLWCVVWGYGGMRTHFSLLNPSVAGSLVPRLPNLLNHWSRLPESSRVRRHGGRLVELLHVKRSCYGSA